MVGSISRFLWRIQQLATVEKKSESIEKLLTTTIPVEIYFEYLIRFDPDQWTNVPISQCTDDSFESILLQDSTTIISV